MGIRQIVRHWPGVMAAVWAVTLAVACSEGRQGAGLQDVTSAADSDSYYMALMQQHKRWYAEMNVDSMVASSDRP